MCINGNYNTTDEEIASVEEFLKRKDIKYLSVEKYENRNGGDIIVKFPHGLYSLFEVKRESTKRFLNFGEYGIDFISSFDTIDCDKNKWKGIHKPCELKTFLKEIDYNKNFKWGKLYYSYSDVWLFMVKDEITGEYLHLEGYSRLEIEKDNFISYIKNNCSFAINNKSINELSYYDKHSSATFFVSPKIMEKYKITDKTIYHNNTFINEIN